MAQGDCQAQEGSAKCDRLKREGECDYSCHFKGCQCGKCARDYCNDPAHFKGCHCGKGR